MANTSPPAPIFYDPSKHQHILAQIADIHHDCVIHDAMPLSILDVSNRSKLDQYWLKKHAEVEDGRRGTVSEGCCWSGRTRAGQEKETAPDGRCLGHFGWRHTGTQGAGANPAQGEPAFDPDRSKSRSTRALN